MVGGRGEERQGRGSRWQRGPYQAITTMGNWSLVPGGNSQGHHRTEAPELFHHMGERDRLYLRSHLLLINGCLGEGCEFSLPACYVQGQRGKILRSV